MGVCGRTTSPGLGAPVREQVAILENAISHITAHDVFNKLAILWPLGFSGNLYTFGQKPAHFIKTNHKPKLTKLLSLLFKGKR